jgi:hypothetical protein
MQEEVAMLYIAEDRSAVMIEEGVYLHVYNPRLSNAPEGAIVPRSVGEIGFILEYTYRDGSSLSVSFDRDGVIDADLATKHETAIITIGHTVSRAHYTLPSDPIVQLFETRDRVVIPLLSRNADTLDSAFFDMSFFPVALVTVDGLKNMLSVESSREAPLTFIRETGRGKDIRDTATIITETLENAGVKVVVYEM